MFPKRVFYKGWSRSTPKGVFWFLLEQQVPRRLARSPHGGRWNGSSHLQPPEIEWDDSADSVVATIYGRGSQRNNVLLKVWPNGSWHFDPEGVLSRGFNGHPWSHYRWMVSMLSPCSVLKRYRHQPFDALYLDGQLFPLDDIAADGLYWNNKTNLFNVVPVVTPNSLGRHYHENPIKDRRFVQAMDGEVKVSEFNERLWPAILLNPLVPLAEKLPILEGKNRYFWESAVRNAPSGQLNELTALAMKRWPRSWSVAELILEGHEIPMQLKMQTAYRMRRKRELLQYLKWVSSSSPSVEVNRLAAAAGLLDRVLRD